MRPSSVNPVISNHQKGAVNIRKSVQNPSNIKIINSAQNKILANQNRPLSKVVPTKLNDRYAAKSPIIQKKEYHRPSSPKINKYVAKKPIAPVPGVVAAKNRFIQQNKPVAVKINACPEGRKYNLLKR